MSLAVIDASVLAVFYVAEDPRHALVVERLKVGDALFAPAHLDAEIVSALRGMARRNHGLEQVVPRALMHLAGFPIRRMPLPPLLDRMWELRHNITSYDAGIRRLGRAAQGRTDYMRCQARYCERA